VYNLTHLEKCQVQNNRREISLQSNIVLCYSVIKTGRDLLFTLMKTVLLLFLINQSINLFLLKFAIKLQ